MSTLHHTRVRDTSWVAPRLRRIVLAGGLDAWTSTGRPDEYVRIQVPGDPPAPGWQEEPALGRFYTVRDWDPHRAALAIDVVVHDGGHGSEWAIGCRPGDPVVLSNPIGYWDPPRGTTDRLLLADATGIPAVARILDEARRDESFRAVIEVAGPDDRIDLPSTAAVEIDWHIAGNGRTPSCLPATVKTMPRPDPDVYVWVACESAVSRRLRTWLRSNWPRDVARYRIVGYWHAAKDEIEARWAALPREQLARSRQLWDPARPDEVNWIDYEAFLQEVGL